MKRNRNKQTNHLAPGVPAPFQKICCGADYRKGCNLPEAECKKCMPNKLITVPMLTGPEQQDLVYDVFDDTMNLEDLVANMEAQLKNTESPELLEALTNLRSEIGLLYNKIAIVIANLDYELLARGNASSPSERPEVELS